MASYDWGDKHSSGLIGVAITSSPEPYVDEASTYCGVQIHGIACNGKISLPNASVACMNVLNDWPTVHFSLVYQ